MISDLPPPIPLTPQNGSAGVRPQERKRKKKREWRVCPSKDRKKERLIAETIVTNTLAAEARTGLPC